MYQQIILRPRHNIKIKGIRFSSTLIVEHRVNKQRIYTYVHVFEDIPQSAQKAVPLAAHRCAEKLFKAPAVKRIRAVQYFLTVLYAIAVRIRIARVCSIAALIFITQSVVIAVLARHAATGRTA